MTAQQVNKIYDTLIRLWYEQNGMKANRLDIIVTSK